MALYKYFEKAPSTSGLPNPNSPLLDRMPSEVILAANCEVLGLALQESTVQDSKTKTTWGPYASFSTDGKVRIAKRAAEFGATNTLRYFQKRFSDRTLIGCMTYMPFCPFIISRKYFLQNLCWPLIHEIYSPRNISALWYVLDLWVLEQILPPTCSCVHC